MIQDPNQRDIFQRHCKGKGSTFSLFLKGDEESCFRFLDALKIAKLAVSLGGTETLASHPASTTHLSVPDKRKIALGITDNLVRISIGIEDPSDLIADFKQALAKGLTDALGFSHDQGEFYDRTETGIPSNWRRAGIGGHAAEIFCRGFHCFSKTK